MSARESRVKVCQHGLDAGEVDAVDLGAAGNDNEIMTMKVVLI